ncbi:MAG TPA: histone [Acidobacteriota bacterium]|nr:histone [Acidobacteriota bacterium]
MTRQTPHPTRTIPLLACKKMLKAAGANRIADDALIVFRQQLEEKVAEIALEALRFAKHAKRRTIQASDITLALQKKSN